MTRDQVVQAIRKAVGETKQKAWCELHGVNQTVLSDVLRKDRPPTKYLCALVGVERVTERITTYRRKKA